MHPLRHPRNAALVGLLFVIIGIIFYAIPAAEGMFITYEVAAGTTLLLFLGVAMAIMAYVLVAGSTDE